MAGSGQREYIRRSYTQPDGGIEYLNCGWQVSSTAVVKGMGGNEQQALGMARRE